MHHTAVLYISPSGRNIVTHGNGGHSEITLFIFVEKREKHFLKELLYSSESALEPPPTRFCHPLLSWDSLLPCPQDPPASPDLLLLLRLWLSPLFRRDHMLANGPPGWAAWRLEGSLVDPPISPGLGEVERGQWCRELHDIPRVLF